MGRTRLILVGGRRVIDIDYDTCADGEAAPEVAE